MYLYHFRWDTQEDFVRNLEMLKGVPEMIEEVIILLQNGISEKMTFAVESIKGTIQQLRALVSSPAESSKFYAQLSRSKYFKDEAYVVIKEKVLPAFKKLLQFLEKEYLRNVRKGPGVISLGHLKGQEYYQACLEYSTTIQNINATELYLFGMRELEKSQKRLVQLTHQLGKF